MKIATPLVLNDGCGTLTLKYKIEKYADIRQKLKRDIPSMKKIEGKNSMKSYVGVFDAENYGRARVYLEDKNSSNCIALKTNEEYVFINLKSEKESKRLYDEISSLVVNK